MSEILKTILRARFKKYFGDGTTKHKCQTPNPSLSKLHAPFPSLEELQAFEQTYAGPDTPALMERYTGWTSGSTKRNKTCLVCLKSTRSPNKAILICNTCPRTIHFACLDDQAPHIWHKQHCPACVKRRWHLIRPVTAVQREDQTDDDYYMQRVRRYHRWHRCNCQHIDEWQRLGDDGSLESDRRLLIEMGVTARKPVVTEGEQSGAAHEGEVQQPEQGERSVPEYQGAAAEYYDPNASWLGTYVEPAASARSKRSAAKSQAAPSSNADGVTDKGLADPDTGPSEVQKPASIVSHKPSVDRGAEPTPSNATVPKTPSVHSRSSKVASVSNGLHMMHGARSVASSKPKSTHSKHENDKSEKGKEQAKSDAGSEKETGTEETPQDSKNDKTSSIKSRRSKSSKHGQKAESIASRRSSRSKISTMPPNYRRSWHSGSTSQSSRKKLADISRSIINGSKISHASTGATSDTSRHIDERSLTDKRPA